MKMSFCRIFFFAPLSIIFLQCSSSKKSTSDSLTLKDAYKNEFKIGAALNTAQIEERDPKMTALIKQQFNALTPENVMKSEVIHRHGIPMTLR